MNLIRNSIKYNHELSGIYPIHSGVPQGSVLGPILYLLYTADLPTTEEITTATFADDIAMLSVHDDPEEASAVLQDHLTTLCVWFKKWRIKINETKSVNTTFTLRRDTCPQIAINNEPIPQCDHIKYLGMTLDRRLTWKEHIKKKRKQLDIKLKNLYWLLGRNSKLSLNNKILVYKVILKPVWTYGIQLWGTASNSNLEILQRFQSKALRVISNAPWYISNANLHKDLHIPTIREEIGRFSDKYVTRLDIHPNCLALNLLDNSEQTRRLKRYHPFDLTTRFK